MKKILSVILAFVFAVILCVPFYAGNDNIGLIDIADGIISDDEYGELFSMVTNAASEADAAVGIIFTNSSLSQNQLKKRADELFDENCDKNGDGIILAVDVESRQYYIRQIGKMNRLYSYAMDEIENAALNGLRKSDWYAAAENFIYAVTENAGYYDKNASARDSGKLISDVKKFETITVIVAIVIALIAVGIMAARMNNARPKRSAENYIKNDSFVLDLKTDMYLYSTVSKTKISTESSGSRGGGGGGGGSRGGRGGSF